MIKRKVLIISIVAAILAVVTTVVAVVVITTGEKAPIDVLQEKYAGVSQATAITQKIEISSGSLLQYSKEAKFTANGSGYSVEVTEKQLNEVTSSTEAAYTTSTDSYTETKATTFVSSLNLKEEYFQEGFTVSATSLKANIVSGHEKDVVGLTEIPSSISNMTLELTATDNNITSIVITYTMNGSSVTISLSFNY